MTIAFNAGQVLTASELNLLAPILKQKATNQVVTASTTLVNDADIVFTFVANQTVHVMCSMLYQSNTTTAVNLRPAWLLTGTGAVGVVRMVLGPNDAAASTPDSMLMQSRSFTFATNGDYATATVANTNLVAREELILTTGSAGCTLQLQWAQFTGTAATSTTMLAGTYAIARYVA